MLRETFCRWLYKDYNSICQDWSVFSFQKQDLSEKTSKVLHHNVSYWVVIVKTTLIAHLTWTLLIFAFSAGSTWSCAILSSATRWWIGTSSHSSLLSTSTCLWTLTVWSPCRVTTINCDKRKSWTAKYKPINLRAFKMGGGGLERRILLKIGHMRVRIFFPHLECRRKDWKTEIIIKIQCFVLRIGHDYSHHGVNVFRFLSFTLSYFK